MEFCAKRIIQPMNTIKKNAPHLIEPDYMKTHKMMNQIRREYDQASFTKFDPMTSNGIYIDPIWPRSFVKLNKSWVKSVWPGPDKITWAGSTMLTTRSVLPSVLHFSSDVPKPRNSTSTTILKLTKFLERQNILRESDNNLSMLKELFKMPYPKSLFFDLMNDLWPWPYRFWTIVRRIPTSPRRQRSFAKKGWSQKCQDTNGNVPQDIQCGNCTNSNNLQATLRKTREGCSFKDQQG